MLETNPLHISEEMINVMACLGSVPSVPYITVLFMYVTGPEVDKDRVQQRIDEGMRFFRDVTTVTDGCWPRCELFPLTPLGSDVDPPYTEGITNSEEIDLNREEPPAIKRIHDFMVALNDWMERSSNVRCPYDVVVIFIPGRFFNRDGQPTNTVGRIYNNGELPFIILLSVGASDQVFAHEVGHALNLSHRDGEKNDPDPDPNQPEHNRNEGNLMYKEAGTLLTKEQISQFCESKIVRLPAEP